MQSPQPQSLPSPETAAAAAPVHRGHAFFSDLLVGYRSAKTVFVANRLNVFAPLQDARLTAPELAATLKTDPRATAVLLDALVALGLLERDAGRYTNAPLARDHLVPSAPGYVGNNLRFLDLLWRCWSDLETVIVTGKPVSSLPELLHGEEADFTTEYIRGMNNFSRRPAEEVARVLSEDAGGQVRRVLDVGGGPGTYTRALLRRNPDATAVLLDLPPTLEVAAQLQEGAPEAARVTLEPGNYLTDGYGGPFDVVLLSHVTHDESPEGILRMLGRAHVALEPGGRVAIHDFVLDSGSAYDALFGVNMLVYTDGGKTYWLREYEDLLKQAGFVDVRAVPVLEGQVANPTQLIIARKAR